jgi:DNA-binding HxlR family transcriptional regulator
MIRGRIVSEYPIKVEYSLTYIGKGLEPVLISAAYFSMQYMSKAVFKDGIPRTPNQFLGRNFWPSSVYT